MSAPGKYDAIARYLVEDPANEVLFNAANPAKRLTSSKPPCGQRTGPTEARATGAAPGARSLPSNAASQSPSDGAGTASKTASRSAATLSHASRAEGCSFATTSILLLASLGGFATLSPCPGRADESDASDWDSTLEPDTRSVEEYALRLGRRIAKVRRSGNGSPYGSVEEVARRANVGRKAIEALAEADAFASLGASRREALWNAKAIERDTPPLLRLAGEAADLSEPSLI